VLDGSLYERETISGVGGSAGSAATSGTGGLY